MPQEKLPTYADPPVVEVIFHLLFEGSAAKPVWSAETAKAFLKKVVPDSSETEILPVPRFEYRDERFTLEAVIERVRSRSKAGDTAVQIGNNVLACHLLRKRGEPFDLGKLIRFSNSEVLPTYLEVFKPSCVVRVGLAYVDIIDVPGDTVDLDQYFNVGARLPEKDGKLLVRAYDFKATVILSKDTDRVLDLEVQTVSSAPKGSCRLRLDWSLSELAATDMNTEQWTREAERVMNEWFYRCLTDKCRELFGSKEK